MLYHYVSEVSIKMFDWEKIEGFLSPKADGSEGVIFKSIEEV